ncbi:hypothetical protein PWR05_32420 [Paraburkholderia sp. A2RI-6]|uniref:hypothetical protein n=1 Tax=Paraburkholderia sp. A2RI-6 TaxID=3028371 RepID=UPI003B7FEF50
MDIRMPSETGLREQYANLQQRSLLLDALGPSRVGHLSAAMGVVAEIGALPGGLTFTCNARVDQDVNFASSCVDSRFFPREDAQGRTQGQRTQRGVPRQELAGLQRGLDRKRRCNHVD